MTVAAHPQGKTLSLLCSTLTWLEHKAEVRAAPLSEILRVLEAGPSKALSALARSLALCEVVGNLISGTPVCYSTFAGASDNDRDTGGRRRW